jgi:hypothetical protein
MLPIPVVNDRLSSTAGWLSSAAGWLSCVVGRPPPADWLYRGLIA